MFDVSGWSAAAYERTELARRVCAGCPVQRECLEAMRPALTFASVVVAGRVFCDGREVGPNGLVSA
jgi:Transcription factor WhiB